MTVHAPLEPRPFAGLGRFRNHWLEAYYHFSFANYYDPARTGVGPLLVWNDDTVSPGRGFASHGHADMEIITVMRSGLLTHRDSVGNVGRIGPGELQTMSAGTGIVHSEVNDEADPLTLFQIWIEPRTRGLAPRWADGRFDWPTGAGLVALASGQGADGALVIDQNMTLFAGRADAPDGLRGELGTGRRGYLVALDPLRIGSLTLAPRDGMVIANGGALELHGGRFILADLP